MGPLGINWDGRILQTTKLGSKLADTLHLLYLMILEKHMFRNPKIDSIDIYFLGNPAWAMVSLN